MKNSCFFFFMTSFFILTCQSLLASEEEKEPPFKARFIVDIKAKNSNQSWVAKAMQFNIIKDLSGFSRLEGASKTAISTKECSHDGCLLEKYKEAGLHLFFKGIIDRDAIYYTVYDVITSQPVKRGEIEIGPHVSLEDIRVETFSAIKPFTIRGGIFDQWQARLEAPTPSPSSQKKIIEKKAQKTGIKEDKKVASKDHKGNQEEISFLKELKSKIMHRKAFLQKAALTLFLAMLIIPSLFFAFLLYLKREHKTQRFFTIYISLLILVTAFLCLLGYEKFLLLDASFILYEPIIFLNKALLSIKWSLPILSGILLGIFILKLLKNVFFGLKGFEKIEQRMIPNLLSSWALISFLRLCWHLAIYLPAIALFWVIGISFHMDFATILILLMPIGCFFLSLWIKHLTEGISLYLDTLLVEGDATRENPWHSVILDFILQYQNRTKRPLPTHLLQNTLFLAHKEDETISYGGGFTKPRVVLDQDLLKAALGIDSALDKPKKAKDKEQVVVDFDDDLGEKEVDTAAAEPEPEGKEGLESQENKKLKTDFMKLENFKELSSFKEFEVDAKGEGGLGTAILQEEDNKEQEEAQPQPEIEEALIAGSDAMEEEDGNFYLQMDIESSDCHDFLYGAILSELGHLNIKGQKTMSTYKRFIKHLLANAPQPLCEWGHLAESLINRYFSKFSATLADSFASLYGGIDHLLQYLYYKHHENRFKKSLKEQSYLTKNGDTKDLETASQNILKEALAWQEDDESRFKTNATERNRVLWLTSYFFAIEKRKKKEDSARRPLKIALASLFILAVSFKILESVYYSKTFKERLASQKEAIEKAREERKKPASRQKS